MHAHTATTTNEIAYSVPVSFRENRAAHGNICQVAKCRCGATRKTNVNGSHRERGAWVGDTDDE